MTMCRDRLFKAVQATMGTKPEKFSHHSSLETIDESAFHRIESKEDAANAVQILINHDHLSKRNGK
jgi:hypothetical protein